ncbi:NAD-dependent succinate-semialdehyde dehydrogenase [Pacificimonas flava]|uniref:NAD-dependent succinate-semialdehyde dehydrogenase n=2 Tax=Pacificimonas TaxID=1960290 RepID=A0A219B7M6_9SPHN|nr:MULTISPECIES: NAD-dependent succinate-semialdehyde dehydrogenase [Pacificimonas]MBZ6378525.1 NAD-dependent succinate-semialdehyde dehydrogenase [Pacificimonas aurantium]OWV34184.1 NAD-dependent succinate-semialdehyde dehydrogenase [Pacificimonas flava]
MTYPTQLSSCIDGEWIGGKGRETETVIEPATGEALADLPHVTAADLDRALEAADRGWQGWRSQTVAERGALLNKAPDLLAGRTDEIAVMLSREQGKPLSQAKADVAVGINILRLHPEEAKRAYGRTLVRGPGKRASVTYEPVGPAAGFAPWNFPFFNVARKVAPALAAGCSIISKPAEETPASAIMLQRALLDAGVPGSASQLVFGDPDMISRHLIASPVIRKISFTGSVPVGRHLAKLAGEALKRTTMELGGHAPVIIFDDADLDKYLDLLVTTKFRNAGQVCVSPTRYYVQEGIYERFAAEFARRTEEMVKLGSPLDEDTVMGPLANARRPVAVGGIIDDAVSCGARVLTGAEPGQGPGYFYRPTVLIDVPEAARIMQEEPFGPVASMRPFKTLDEAVAMANRLPYGLAAYVFTENLNRALLASGAIEAGMVAVNSMTLASGDAPFGGIKDSGHGMEDGPEGLQAYMVPKVVHIG